MLPSRGRRLPRRGTRRGTRKILASRHCLLTARPSYAWASREMRACVVACVCVYVYVYLCVRVRVRVCVCVCVRVQSRVHRAPQLRAFSLALSLSLSLSLTGDILSPPAPLSPPPASSASSPLYIPGPPSPSASPFRARCHKPRSGALPQPNMSLPLSLLLSPSL
jgi:hypothetical protein